MLRQVRNFIRERRSRRASPWLYDEARHRDRLIQLASTRPVRRVSVVGNAQSIFATEAGPEIDSADLVFRINRGFARDPLRQGRRTDVLCLATPMTPKEIDEHFGRPIVIVVTPWRWNAAAPLLGDPDGFFCYPIDAWHSLSATLGNRRPSAGCMAVDIARNSFGATEVRLFGFDWKATKTFYASRLRYNHHDWDRERGLMESWADEGWLVLPPGYRRAS